MRPDNNLQNLREKSLAVGDKYEMDSWVLHLPPINLYNVELVYLAFGYDTKWDIRNNSDDNDSF